MNLRTQYYKPEKASEPMGERRALHIVTGLLQPYPHFFTNVHNFLREA